MEAGVDEAGRGCFAGPVFAAAVILPPHFRHPLLNDSKQVSAEYREILREHILSTALAWSVALASEAEIDRINILNASHLAMHRAIAGLHLLPEHLLIDGNRFRKYDPIPHTCIIEGDAKYSAIAAASILAKTFRDDYMRSLDADYPQYGWKQNKGYGTPYHREMILEHGSCIYHRQSFNLTGNTQQSLF